MKRLISFVLVVMMLGLLAGCGCGKNDSDQETTIAWEKGESLFGSTLKEYADACKTNDKKGVEAKQKLTTSLFKIPCLPLLMKSSSQCYLQNSPITTCTFKEEFIKLFHTD